MNCVARLAKVIDEQDTRKGSIGHSDTLRSVVLPTLSRHPVLIHPAGTGSSFETRAQCLPLHFGHREMHNDDLKRGSFDLPQVSGPHIIRIVQADFVRAPCRIMVKHVGIR